TSLGSLPIRGYPGTTLYVKAAEISSLDLRFPIAQIFRGLGTNPVFLDRIYGFGFVEATYLPFSEDGPPVLPAVGGGVVSNLELFVGLPVTASVEYHYGFRPEAGGGGQVFLA